MEVSFRRILLFILCAISILLIINLLFLANIIKSDSFISQLELYVSPDHQIEHPAIIFVIIQGELILGFFAIFYSLKKGKNFAISTLNKVSFLICFLFFLLAFIPYWSTFIPMSLYAEDNVFEYFTALLHLASSFLFLLLILRNKKKKTPSLVLFLLFALFFFIGMEEISWGQRLLGIGTPGFMKEINYLDEINAHNIITYILTPRHTEIIYYCFYTLVGLTFLLKDSVEIKIKKMDVAKRIIPLFPPSDFFYFGLLIFAMLLANNFIELWESLELIFAVIAFTYAIHVYRRCKKLD